jgi:hypothetical protein
MMQLENLKKTGLRLVNDKQRNAREFDPIPINLVPVLDSLVVQARSSWPTTQTSAKVKWHYRSDIETAVRDARALGDTPLSQNKVLDLVAGNSAAVTDELQALANDPTSPITMTKKGRSYQYDWNEQAMAD